MTASAPAQPGGLPRPDDFYAELLALHEGLSDAQSQALNARLVLVLAHELGLASAQAGATPDATHQRLRTALHAARHSLQTDTPR